MAKSVKTIRKTIQSVALASSKVGERVHKVALDCLEHYKEHGDSLLCSELVQAVKQTGIYRKALVQWFKKHGHLEARKGNAGLVFVKETKKFDHKQVDMAAAAEDFFGSQDTDTDANLPKFDAYRAIEMMLKKDAKAKEEPEAFSEIKSQLREGEVKVLTAMLANHKNAKGESAGNVH